MNKTILSLVLVAFAFAPALQAGDGKENPKSKSSCTAQEASCPMQKSSCCADAVKAAESKSCCAQGAGASCGTKKARVTKKMDASVKGAQLLVQR